MFSISRNAQVIKSRAIGAVSCQSCWDGNRKSGIPYINKNKTEFLFKYIGEYNSLFNLMSQNSFHFL